MIQELNSITAGVIERYLEISVPHCLSGRLPDIHGEGVAKLSYGTGINLNGPQHVSPTRVAYVRVGDRVFVDSCYRERMEKVLGDCSKSVLYLEHFDSILGWGHEHMAYSSLMARATRSAMMFGSHVLDLGAGDGLASLVALSSGASRVIAVDRDEEPLEKMRRHLQANDFDLGGVRQLCYDITDPSLEEALVGEQPHIVLANIGKNQYPGDPSSSAIALAGKMPSVFTFVGSGYARGCKHDPQEDLDALAAYGFRSVRFFEFVAPPHAADAGKVLLSFVATRPRRRIGVNRKNRGDRGNNGNRG